jgi:hypothetical protein
MWMLAPYVTLEGATLVNPILDVLAQNAPAVAWPNGPSVFAGVLPEKYNPRQSGNGMAIVVSVGGSGLTKTEGQHTEIPMIDPRMYVRVWAGNNEFARARQLDLAIFDWIHAKTSLDFGDDGFVLSSINQVFGQDITDPSGLVTIFSWYHLTLREN